MRKKRFLRFIGSILTFIGIVLFLNSYTGITGFVILGDLTKTFSYTLSLVLIGLGLLSLFIGKQTIEDIVEDLKEEIDEQRQDHKANPNFLRGLDKIEDNIDRDYKTYENITPNARGRSTGKTEILYRLDKWKEGLKNRERNFFELPKHIPGVVDMPDKGLYPYHSLGGKKSKFVELELTHYTTQQSYAQIKNVFKTHGKELIRKDEAGWAYFLDNPLPEGLSVKRARTIIGTGEQFYVGKERPRDPESFFKLKIRVPKERVLVKDQVYETNEGSKINVKKYAIAGGIKKEDLVEDYTPTGGRYKSRGLADRRVKVDKW